MKELTGIPINYMITVNFRAFRRIVDSVDGVYMDVDRRYFNDNSQADTCRASTSSPATSSSKARTRSTSSATGTPTPTSTASSASRSS